VKIDFEKFEFLIKNLSPARFVRRLKVPALDSAERGTFGLRGQRLPRTALIIINRQSTRRFWNFVLVNAL
jgi:hypothetical protein